LSCSDKKNIERIRTIGKIQELKEDLIGVYTGQINDALDKQRLGSSAESNILETLKHIDMLLK
jgi:hypothetical protein